MESWAVGWNGRGANKDFFKKETEVFSAQTSPTQQTGHKEGRVEAQFAPTQCTSCTAERGTEQSGLLVPGGLKCEE